MKIIFVMNTGFDSHTTSEHLLGAIIEQLVILGNDVHVVQWSQGGDLPVLPQKLVDLGVTTDCVSLKPPRKTGFVLRYLTALRFYWKCRPVFKKHHNVGAVFLQSTNVAGFAVWMAKRYNRKAIITYNVQDVFPHNAVYSGSVSKNSFVFRILSSVQRYGYMHSDHVITISEDMKETLIRTGVNDDRLDVIYNWSYQDETYDNVDITPIDHMFDKTLFNVVYAGNIGVMQNVDLIIKTAGLMQNEKGIWFHIIGDGVYKEKLQKKAKEIGISNITFWPMQSPDLAPAIYSAADVNVIPLVKGVYRTALPSKTATCLACQKPIIFAFGKKSKFGREAVREAGCVLVGSDQADELANAIKGIRNGQLQCHTKEYYRKNFSISENSKKYARIITQVRD